MGKGWPGLKPEFVEEVAKTGLRVLVRLAERHGTDATFDVYDALGVSHRRDDPAFRGLTSREQANVVTFTFDTLIQQGIVTGTFQEQEKLLAAAIATSETTAKLEAKDASGHARVASIHQALDLADAGSPPPFGTFTTLAREIGLEP